MSLVIMGHEHQKIYLGVGKEIGDVRAPC